MRAFVLYNDSGTIGVSIIAIPSTTNWRPLEVHMEDTIGALKTIEEVAEVVKTFPSKFPDVKFHRGMVYGDMDKAVQDVINAGTNPISGNGYKIVNPPSIKVEFVQQEVVSGD